MSLQGVAEVGCVGDEEDLAHTEALCAALLELVGAHADELVFVGFGVAGEDLFVAHGLALYELLAGEAGVVAVGYAPDAVVCDLRGHVPVCGVDDEVGVPVVEALVEGKVDLACQRRGRCRKKLDQHL